MTSGQWNATGEIYGTDTGTGQKRWISSQEMNEYWTPTQKDENVLLKFSSPQKFRFERDSKARYKNKTYIQKADLTSLDELREKILKAGSTTYHMLGGAVWE